MCQHNAQSSARQTNSRLAPDEPARVALSRAILRLLQRDLLHVTRACRSNGQCTLSYFGAEGARASATYRCPARGGSAEVSRACARALMMLLLLAAAQSTCAAAVQRDGRSSSLLLLRQLGERLVGVARLCFAVLVAVAAAAPMASPVTRARQRRTATGTPLASSACCCMKDRPFLLPVSS